MSAITKEDRQLFRSVFAKATKLVAERYFLLRPASDKSDKPYAQRRERVYAYELYHQHRLKWPKDSRYAINGEVDKSGHSIIKKCPDISNSIPDMLVHVPNTMDGNLA